MFGRVSQVYALLIMLSGLGLTLAGLTLLARRVRRRGVGHSVIAPFEIMWHPAGYDEHTEVSEQRGRKAPAPSPGDPPQGVTPDWSA
jgi:hypothetical protein